MKGLLLFGREEEQQTLHDAWESLLLSDDRASPRIVFITGPSGSGKSSLARSLKTPSVVVNRFDRLTPLQPFEWKKSKSLSSKQISPEEEISQPEEETALPLMSRHRKSLMTVGAGAGIMRPHRRSLMRASLKNINTPTVWVVEDFHHADERAVEIWKDVVSMSKSAAVLFVVTCDKIPESLQTNHDLMQTIQHIHLGPLSRASVQKLCDSVSVTNKMMSVDKIYEQARGNPLHALELSQASQDLMVGAPSLEELYRNQVLLMDETLEQLLQVASCFGQTVPRDLLNLVLPSDKIDEQLARLSSFLVTTDNDVYEFVHESAQRAVYGMFDEEGAPIHLKIARKLWCGFSDQCLKDHIFQVLHQAWWGRDLLTDENERYGVASMCHYAAEEAVRATNFGLASQLLEWGMGLVEDLENRWREQYDLTLALYNGTCETAYHSGDYDRVEECLEAVEMHARTFPDKVTARTMHMSCFLNSPAKGLALGETYLQEGKVKLLPKSGKKAQLMIEVMQMKLALNRKSDEQIMRLPAMTDPDHLACMQIMNMCVYHAHFLDAEAPVFLAIRMLQLTLKHGFSSFSCLGFAYWATVLCAMRRFNEANRFADLALRLLKKYQTTDIMSTRVHLAVYGFVKPWKYFHAAVLEPLHNAYRSGLEQGDVEFAFGSSTMYVIHFFWAGRSLAELETSILETLDVISTRGSTSMATERLTSILLLVRSLRGTRESMLVVDVKAKLKDWNMSAVGGADHVRLMGCFTFSDQMISSYLMGNCELAAESAHVARQIFKLHIPGTDAFKIALFDGLVSLERLRQGHRKRFHVSNARKQLKRLKKLAYVAPRCFLGQYYLLQAQLLAITKTDQKKVEMKFLASIAVVETNEMSLERGLSNYLFAKYLDSVGDFEGARSHIHRAVSIFEQWGATAVARHLSVSHQNTSSQGHRTTASTVFEFR